MEHGDDQGPLEEDGRQARDQLRREEQEDQPRRAPQARDRPQAPRHEADIDKHDDRKVAMHPVNRGECGLRDHCAAGRLAQAPDQGKAACGIHVGQPGAVAGGEIHTGERRVVRAHPATKRDLDEEQRQRDRDPRQRPGGARRNRIMIGLARGKPGHQRKQDHPAEQVPGDHHGHELMGDCPGAEGPLHADRDQRDKRQRGGLAEPCTVAPRHPARDDDQEPERGADIPVHHLDPGLGQRHRAFGHGLCRLVNILQRADRRHVAIAAGPIRATEARVGQAHEGAEHDQVQRQEPRQENDPAIAGANGVLHA